MIILLIFLSMCVNSSIDWIAVTFGYYCFIILITVMPCYQFTFGSDPDATAGKGCSWWAEATARSSSARSPGSPAARAAQNQRKVVLQENLLFSLTFGNLNFHQCKNKFLLPALRRIGTTFCLGLCRFATSGRILASESRTQRMAFLVREVLLQGQEN